MLNVGLDVAMKVLLVIVIKIFANMLELYSSISLELQMIETVCKNCHIDQNQLFKMGMGDV